MSDYLIAAWRTAKVTAAIIGVMAAIFVVMFGIVVGGGYLFHLIGGDTLLNIVSVIMMIVGIIWLFVLPIVDLFKSNLRKIRNERNKDAQISID